MSDGIFHKYNRIYKAHQPNVWWTMNISPTLKSEHLLQIKPSTHQNTCLCSWHASFSVNVTHLRRHRQHQLKQQLSHQQGGNEITRFVSSLRSSPFKNNGHTFQFLKCKKDCVLTGNKGYMMLLGICSFLGFFVLFCQRHVLQPPWHGD